jgi:hypothetical protein
MVVCLVVISWLFYLSYTTYDGKFFNPFLYCHVISGIGSGGDSHFFLVCIVASYVGDLARLRMVGSVLFKLFFLCYDRS